MSSEKNLELPLELNQALEDLNSELGSLCNMLKVLSVVPLDEVEIQVDSWH